MYLSQPRRRVSAALIVSASLMMAGCSHHAAPVTQSQPPPVPVASAPPAPAPPAVPTVGQPAPAFSTVTTTGKPISLASLRGKVVLVDYWATWCTPCKMAMPTLEALHRRFAGKGLDVVGISVDDPSTVKNVPAVVKKLGVTYTIAASPKADAQDAQNYDAEGIPDQFLIDKKGIIRWMQDGFSYSEKQQLSSHIKQLLAEPA